jgi:hypothetical protein
MYLNFYKNPYLTPEININELWEIYDLDSEWAEFYTKK